jgi:hypothetical protein
MRIRRVTAAIGMLATLLTAGAMAIPLQPASASGAATASAHHSAPAQLTSAGPATSMAALPPPSTSPSTFHCNGSNVPNWVKCIVCPAGAACAFVCCNTGVNWFFRFYNGIYHLSYWHGLENLINNQTDGWTVRTLGQSGNLIHCYGERKTYDNVNWDPVWSIKLSSAAC